MMNPVDYLQDLKDAVDGLPVDFIVGNVYIKVFLDDIECGAIMWGSDSLTYAAVIAGGDPNRGIYASSSPRAALVRLVNAGINEKIFDMPEPVLYIQGMINVVFMNDTIGQFKGLTSIEGKTYVKYLSGWDDIRTIPLEVVCLA